MTDYTYLVSTVLKEIKRHETEFEKFEKVEEKISFIREKVEMGSVNLPASVRKWTKEAQFQLDCSKSQELREKGDNLYLSIEFDKALQLYRYLIQLKTFQY